MWEIFSFGEKPYNGMKHNDLKNFLKNKNRIDVRLDFIHVLTFEFSATKGLFKGG